MEKITHINDFIGSLPKIRTNGPVFNGIYISAKRNDGRIFDGKVVKVAAYLSTDKVKRPGDTLVTVQTREGIHKSFYLSDTDGWLTVGT